MKKQTMTKERLVRVIWLMERKLGTDWLNQMVTGIGVDQPTILGWKAGNKLPSCDHLKKLSDFYQKLWHDRRGNDPTEWFRKGEELLAASGVLKVRIDEWWEAAEKLLGGQRVKFPPDVSLQFLMLRSFALECFFKGLIVQNGRRLVTNGKYGGEGHHSLTTHAKNAGLKLSSIENEMLDRLEKHNSLGRYPVLRHYAADVFWSRIDRAGKCHWQVPQDENTFVGVLGKIKQRR